MGGVICVCHLETTHIVLVRIIQYEPHYTTHILLVLVRTTNQCTNFYPRRNKQHNFKNATVDRRPIVTSTNDTPSPRVLPDPTKGIQRTIQPRLLHPRPPAAAVAAADADFSRLLLLLLFLTSRCCCCCCCLRVYVTAVSRDLLPMQMCPPSLPVLLQQHPIPPMSAPSTTTTP